MTSIRSRICDISDFLCDTGQPLELTTKAAGILKAVKDFFSSHDKFGRDRVDMYRWVPSLVGPLFLVLPP